jgi:methylated-DNA-[protein]-cysteine S-methyltransferase
MSYRYTRIDSPVGLLTLVAKDDQLTALLWPNERPNRVILGDMKEDPDHPTLLNVAHQLAEYFSGQRTQFDIALDFHGTLFQQQVWQALLTIPYGETRSYAQIAAQIGNPQAVRAVGAANGRNPISIITPCHRVVGSDGRLTGFAGGLEAKLYLLQLEMGTEVAPTATADHNTKLAQRAGLQRSLFDA